MTFIRAFITAAMAAGLAHYAGDDGNQIVVTAIGYCAWQFTTDPLPAAVERGLKDFRERHLR
jgi:hypothetical protein